MRMLGRECNIIAGFDQRPAAQQSFKIGNNIASPEGKAQGSVSVCYNGSYIKILRLFLCKKAIHHEAHFPPLACPAPDAQRPHGVCPVDAEPGAAKNGKTGRSD
jgi:hypothetical protein